MRTNFTVISLLLMFNLFSQDFEIVDIDIPDDYYGSVQLFDIDNDTDLDILFTGSDGSSGNENMETIILINQGNDIFSKLNHSIPGTEHGNIRVIDYNRDSLMDIFVKGFNPPNKFSKLYKNTGDSLIEIYEFNPGLSSGDAQWADLNNDSLPDLVELGQNDSYENDTRVFKNNGDDTFSEMPVDFIDIYAGTIDVKDFNNDSLNDILIVGGFQDNYVKLYKNNGDFQFDSVEINIPGINKAGALWDQNNDKHFDILVSGFTQFPEMVTRLYKNIGDTLFVPTNYNFRPLSSSSISIADFNSDSLTDIIISGEDQTTGKDYIIIYYNTLDSIVQYIDNSFIGLSSGEISCGDYDVDGDIDFIITGYDGSKKTILYKNLRSINLADSKTLINKIIKINVYPNPSKDVVFINFKTDHISNVNVELMDLKGTIIKNLYNSNLQGDIQLKFDLDLQCGIYLLNIKIDNIDYVKKLIIN